MPIEDATVEWKEEDSPYLQVARIRIPAQRLDDAAIARRPVKRWLSIPGTVWRSIDPWQSQPGAPGNLSRARQVPARTCLTAFAATNSPAGNMAFTRAFMADDLAAKIARPLQERPWYALPRCSRCCGWSRFGTSFAKRTSTTPKSRRSSARTSRPNLDPRLREGRTVDGTHNDLHFPTMGCCRPPVRPQLPAGARVPRYAESAHSRTRAWSAAS